MQVSKRSFLIFLFNLLLALPLSAQLNLKSAKKLVKPKTTKTAMKSPCDNNGTVKIVEGNRAFRMYQNVEKRIDLAEEHASKGQVYSTTKNLKMAKDYLKSLLRQEPNADISALCDRIKSLSNKSDSTANDDKEFSQIAYFLNRYYRPLGSVPKPEQFGFFHGDFKEKSSTFKRDEILSRVSNSSSNSAKEVETILNDYSGFVDREGIVEFLMNKLDEANNSASNELSLKAQDVKLIAEGLQNIAGNNTDVNRLVSFANKQLGKADAQMSGIYTSDFHKKNVNKVVFTKEKFIPGQEASVDINPTFVAGDAIYATVYLSTTIKDAIDSWKGSGKGGTMALEVENSNGDFLNRRFESWEVSSYSNYEVSISDATDKQQTYVQFVLIPNKESDLTTELKCNNITPILMARGLSLASERIKKYTVEIKASGQKTGFVKYKGSFKIDLASGEGPSYYSQAENVHMEILLASNPLPTAKFSNGALETQLLAEMKKQGFQEQFKKVYLQRDWQLFKPLLETPYREMKASFTYTTAEGKCGWQTYSFRSFKTGSGWSGPQKWGGADQRQRLSCSKVK